MSIAKFQETITCIAASASVDLRFPGARVCLEQAGRGCLCIETIDHFKVMVVQRWDDEDETYLSPCVVVFTAMREWIPLQLSSRNGSMTVAELDDNGRFIVRIREEALESVAALCEEWGANIVESGWVDGAEYVCVDRGEEKCIADTLESLLSELGIEFER